MRTVLVIAGICAVLAGLLAIGFGIPVKEFSFGNTLILVGAMMLCAGMILLGLWEVVRELRIIGRRLGTVGPEPRVRPVFTAPASGSVGAPSAEGRVFLSASDHRAPERAVSSQPLEPETEPTSPLRAYEDVASRNRARHDALPEPVEAAPTPKPRNNLLFSSTLRRDRELARTRMTERSTSDTGTAAAAMQPTPEPSEAPPAIFEDAWPKADPSSAAEVPLRRSTRAPSTFADPSVDAAEPDHPPAATRSEDAPIVSVIKSGVVDGMAYSLYSDGSIEAQMPEGMMRFASIDELRAHLDQRT